MVQKQKILWLAAQNIFLSAEIKELVKEKIDSMNGDQLSALGALLQASEEKQEDLIAGLLKRDPAFATKMESFAALDRSAQKIKNT